MTEPAVALTDYALFAECAVFAFLLMKTPERAFNRWFALFFGSLGAGAFFGGTVHGFFLDETTLGYKVLWPASLLGLGVTAVAAWGSASRMVLSVGGARTVTRAAGVLFLGYAVVVLFVNQAFLVAVLHYLPSAVFLLAAWIVRYARKPSPHALAGAGGMGLTFAAAGVQMGRISPHDVYFNHNALYHLIQAAALLLVFLAARRMSMEEEAG